MIHNFSPPDGYVQWLTWKVDGDEKRARWDRYVTFIERAWIRHEQGEFVTSEHIDQAVDRHTDLTRTRVVATLAWHTEQTNWRSWSQKGSGQLIVQTIEKPPNSNKRRCMSVTYYVMQKIVLKCSHPLNKGPFFNEDFYWNTIPLFVKPTSAVVHLDNDSEPDIEIIED